MSKPKYFLGIFASSEPADMAQYMNLMTRSLSDETVHIIKEETTFTKEGTYIVALHWTEDGASEDDRKAVRELIKDGL